MKNNNQTYTASKIGSVFLLLIWDILIYITYFIWQPYSKELFNIPLDSWIGDSDGFAYAAKAYFSASFASAIPGFITKFLFYILFFVSVVYITNTMFARQENLTRKELVKKSVKHIVLLFAVRIIFDIAALLSMFFNLTAFNIIYCIVFAGCFDAAVIALTVRKFADTKRVRLFLRRKIALIAVLILFAVSAVLIISGCMKSAGADNNERLFRFYLTVMFSDISFTFLTFMAFYCLFKHSAPNPESTKFRAFVRYSIRLGAVVMLFAVLYCAKLLILPHSMLYYTYITDYETREKTVSFYRRTGYDHLISGDDPLDDMLESNGEPEAVITYSF